VDSALARASIIEPLRLRQLEVVQKGTSADKNNLFERLQTERTNKKVRESDDKDSVRDTITPGRMALIPKRYKENLGADTIAGLTNSIVNVPSAIADSILAGVNPIYALRALIVGIPVAGLTTSSELMSVSTTAAMALIISASLSGVASNMRIEALFVLTFLVGVFQLLAGLLKLGRLTRFVSNAVMTGFLSGVAVLIILGQLGAFTGYNTAGSNKLVQTLDLLTHLNSLNPISAFIGIATLVIIIVIYQTRLRNFAAVIAVIGTTAVVQLLGLGSVALVGSIAEISIGPLLPALPNLLLSPLILGSSLTIAIIGLIQGVGVSGSIPNSNGEYPDISRDFAGQGLGNIVAGLFQGMPLGGSVSQTAIMLAAGARTRLANVLTGVFIAILVIIFGAQLKVIPLPTIAALLVVAGVEIIRGQQVREVWRTSLSSRTVLLVTFGATLILPIQIAVLFGVAVSVVLHIYKTSLDIQLVELVVGDNGSLRERTPPGALSNNRVTVLDFYGSAFFASASTMQGLLPKANESKRAVVILRLRGRRELGSTFLKVLGRYAQELKDNGGKLVLTGVTDDLNEQLRRSKYGESLGENIFLARDELGSSTLEAVTRANEWLEHEG
jgi:sulfate permease, SulP family